MITVYAIEINDKIVALFKEHKDGEAYACQYHEQGAILHAWTVPAETFEFE